MSFTAAGSSTTFEAPTTAMKELGGAVEPWRGRGDTLLRNLGSLSLSLDASRPHPPLSSSSTVAATARVGFAGAVVPCPVFFLLHSATDSHSLPSLHFCVRVCI
ncbi:hypothetical protein PIB30_114177, partial [Stylosanthes scabra]|nr:hypothetical protein [Stylosanthes scabra]